MQRRTIPSYLLHKPSGRARVRIDGKDHYLGPFNSPESRREYATLISEWSERQEHAPRAVDISKLTMLFLEHAKRRYVKHGNSTSTVQRLDGVEGTAPEEVVRKERLRALHELDQAQAAVAEAEKNRIKRQKQMQVASEAERIQAQERLLSASERLADSEQKALGLLKAQSEQLKATVDLRRQQYSTAWSDNDLSALHQPVRCSPAQRTHARGGKRRSHYRSRDSLLHRVRAGMVFLRRRNGE